MAVGQLANPRSVSVPQTPPNYQAITPSDSAVYERAVMLEVWSSGALTFTPYGSDSAGDVTLTITAAMVANGPFLVKVPARAVKATGTSVTTILGIW